MRQTEIFSGSSHPDLVDNICERLGQKPGKATLKKFSNGETCVEIHTSMRDQDVFIVQSGSSKINDNVMELLIMISACKGGSAKSITAVMPYFPYSRQSKKKSHRGAITARMLANLLHVAGVNHVITIDLHASQMQGFFKCPVDNLIAEPLIARWIRLHVPNWRDAVVVSKNPGGTKRVTSLADALKLSFGIVTTDSRRRPDPGMSSSAFFGAVGIESEDPLATDPSVALLNGILDGATDEKDEGRGGGFGDGTIGSSGAGGGGAKSPTRSGTRSGHHSRGTSSLHRRVNGNSAVEVPSSPLVRSVTRPDSSAASSVPSSPPTGAAVGGSLVRVQTTPSAAHAADEPDADAQYTDERARDVITGRLIQGHIVDEDHPSPAFSAASGPSAAPSLRFRSQTATTAGTTGTTATTGGGGGGGSDDGDPDAPMPEHMMSSFVSTASSAMRGAGGRHALGGSVDAAATSEEEEEELRNPELETTVTLVGNVRDRPVFIVDDMIDKAGSWVAAAETVVKRGGATKVYCFATHGLFGGDCLREMNECECIDGIVVTNSFPVPREKALGCAKLVVIDVGGLLAEAIRRNHHGESISQLYMHSVD
ncbi:phosphoribosyltransferase-like protein [Lineolata rhizophorae]|uniref:Ribose-phosphate pyrophosphokinase 1 n=1 Tax=Lineolata rhizophorae TaxID=578093 RepID=A0A6A6NWM6_9PEZI|nr:phosphoribosyltransferase-like protein [Lineolata rhizophorae]